MGNRQVADEITKLLDVKGVPVQQVLEIVREYCNHLDDSARQEHQDLMNYARAIAKRTGTPGFDEAEEQEDLQIRPERKDHDKEKKQERRTATAAPDSNGTARKEEKRPAEKEKRDKDEKKEKKDKKKDKEKDKDRG